MGIVKLRITSWNVLVKILQCMFFLIYAVLRLIFLGVLYYKVRNTVSYRYFDLGSVPVRYGIPSGMPRCTEYCSTATVLQYPDTVLQYLGPVTVGPRTENLSDRYVPPVPGGMARYGRLCCIISSNQWSMKDSR